MTRTILSRLAIAAALVASAAPPAASQNRKPKEIVVVGSGANQSGKARPGNISRGRGGQQKQVSESISLNFDKLQTPSGGSARRSSRCATPGNCWPTHKPKN